MHKTKFSHFTRSTLDSLLLSYTCHPFISTFVEHQLTDSLESSFRVPGWQDRGFDRALLLFLSCHIYNQTFFRVTGALFESLPSFKAFTSLSYKDSLTFRDSTKKCKKRKRNKKNQQLENNPTDIYNL